MITIQELRKPINRSKIISPVLHPNRFERIRREIEQKITGKTNQHYFIVFGPYLAVNDIWGWGDSILDEDTSIGKMHPLINLVIKYPDNIKLFVAFEELLPLDLGVQIMFRGNYTEYSAYIEDPHHFSVPISNKNMFKNERIGQRIEDSIDRLIIDPNKTMELTDPEYFPRENILTIPQIKEKLDASFTTKREKELSLPLFADQKEFEDSVKKLLEKVKNQND